MSFIEQNDMHPYLDRVQDEVTNTIVLILGAFLFVTPWTLGYTDQHTVAWNAWLSGGLVAGVVLLAVTETFDWEEYTNVAAGLWIAVSPWALNFADQPSLRWTHLAVGVAVYALSGFELWRLWLAGEPFDKGPRPSRS